MNAKEFLKQHPIEKGKRPPEPRTRGDLWKQITDRMEYGDSICVEKKYHASRLRKFIKAGGDDSREAVEAGGFRVWKLKKNPEAK